MTTSGETPIRMPNCCPACNRTLYSSSHSRPGPSSTVPARLLFVVAGVVVAVIYCVLFFILREKLATRSPLSEDSELVQYPPTIFVSLISLPVALIPGLAIGWAAARIPRVRLIRCWNCGWSWSYPVTAIWASDPVGVVPTTITPQQQPIVDDSDPWKECRAWAYAEIRTGRSPEDVTEELVAQGWARDEVEGMVEQCRREARDRKMRS